MILTVTRFACDFQALDCREVSSPCSVGKPTPCPGSIMSSSRSESQSSLLDYDSESLPIDTSFRKCSPRLSSGWNTCNPNPKRRLKKLSPSGTGGRESIHSTKSSSSLHWTGRTGDDVRGITTDFLLMRLSFAWTSSAEATPASESKQPQWSRQSRVVTQTPKKGVRHVTVILKKMKKKSILFLLRIFYDVSGRFRRKCPKFRTKCPKFRRKCPELRKKIG